MPQGGGVPRGGGRTYRGDAQPCAQAIVGALKQIKVRTWRTRRVTEPEQPLTSRAVAGPGHEQEQRIPGAVALGKEGEAQARQLFLTGHRCT